MGASMSDPIYSPTWRQHEKGISSDNIDTALAATESFVDERAKELATSARARNFESNRRKTAAAEKREFVKKRLAAEQAPLRQAIKKLKEGGSFENNITPMPGFVLVEVDKEEQTRSGIILGEVELMMQNTGTVRAVGNPVALKYGIQNPPVAIGQRVMFKKGLPGLEVTINDTFCLLMQWSDLLAVIND